MEPLDKPLVNRVAQSGLITIDLEEYASARNVVQFDIKDYLFQELVLREKEFRVALAGLDWSQYAGQVLIIYCSSDAIVPTWAYMLIAAQASPYAEEVFFGTASEFRNAQILAAIDQLDGHQFQDARVVVKGCGREAVPERAYIELLTKLQPYVKSLMYGEPCSTVPVYKRK